MVATRSDFPSDEGHDGTHTGLVSRVSRALDQVSRSITVKKTGEKERKKERGRRGPDTNGVSNFEFRILESALVTIVVRTYNFRTLVIFERKL